MRPWTANWEVCPVWSGLPGTLPGSLPPELSAPRQVLSSTYRVIAYEPKQDGLFGTSRIPSKDEEGEVETPADLKLLSPFRIGSSQEEEEERRESPLSDRNLTAIERYTASR